MRMMLLAAAAFVVTQVSPPPAQIRAAGTRNAVTGRVPDRRPAGPAVVTLLERDVIHGNSRVHLANAQLHVPTDANGGYAIQDAPIGEYFVVAIPHNAFRTADGPLNRAGFGVTYYPSAPSADAAMPITINVREAQTANIVMRPASLATVSGTVLNSKGEPAADERLHIAHGDRLFGIDSAVVSLRHDGTFTLPPLPPGTYFLQYRENGWPPPRDVPQLISAATVVIGGDGHDLAGVKVVPLHMVHGAGRVIVDPSSREQLHAADFHVAVMPVVSDGNPGPQRAGALRDDLSFELDAWPAKVWMRVMPEDAGWQITRVRYRGADVTDTGIDFKEGEPVSGIEIELVRRR